METDAVVVPVVSWRYRFLRWLYGNQLPRTTCGVWGHCVIGILGITIAGLLVAVAMGALAWTIYDSVSASPRAAALAAFGGIATGIAFLVATRTSHRWLPPFQRWQAARKAASRLTLQKARRVVCKPVLYR